VKSTSYKVFIFTNKIKSLNYCFALILRNVISERIKHHKNYIFSTSDAYSVRVMHGDEFSKVKLEKPRVFDSVSVKA